MATKQNHIDYVYNEGYSKIENLTKTMAEFHINIAYNQICSTLLNRYDLCRKRFTNIPVVWDTTAGVYYSNYPAAIIPTINADMIVELIYGSGIRINPTSENTLLVTQGLLVNDIDTSISTILKRDRIEYYNMETYSDQEISDGENPTPKISTVRMDLAIQFKEFLSTDVVYFPAGKDYEVLQLAIDLMKQQPIMEVRNG
jgi:hypothetical protein